VTSRRDAFYAERDRRTLQYGGVDDALELPVLIVVGADVAATRAGQIAALALVNMVARVHRRIGLVVPDAPLLAHSLIPVPDFPIGMISTARAINPVLDLYLGSDIDAQSFVASIGLGADVPTNLDVYLDWHGGRGSISDAWLPGESDPDSVFGAATAAVLGSAALFRLSHGQPVYHARFNPLELIDGDAAGTRDYPGPIDVGDVLVVGAGAVAAGLMYWVSELGVHGTWDIVDGDFAELHNTNRCLTMTAEDAGWPGGTRTTKSISKAASVARMAGGRASVEWYQQWQPDHQERHDLVLPLANGPDLRTLIAQRGEPVLLHATTSGNWTAELHRHRPDRDDCPSCRIPDTARPQLACATGPAVVEEPDSPDAALPFLSAAAGLMLAATLADFPDATAMTQSSNHWRLDLTLTGKLLWLPLQHPPLEGCRQHIQSGHIRHQVQGAEPRRWDHLDR